MSIETLLTLGLTAAILVAAFVLRVVILGGLESISGAVIAGLVSFFSPCVIPLLPGYLSAAVVSASGDMAVMSYGVHLDDVEELQRLRADLDALVAGAPDGAARGGRRHDGASSLGLGP